jgi:thiamine-monophosphate kinase
MKEFEIIALYFKPLTLSRAEAGELQNDTAVLNVPDGMQLVVTSDTLIAGVHFLPDQSPYTIAQKVLRTNISDLTAAGAKPYCYQLCLSMPSLDENFLDGFSKGLSDDQKRYDIFLSGGDTTKTTGPLSISITAMGFVPHGRGIGRSGAQDGDLIIVSGEVGDAYCGLQASLGKLEKGADTCVCLYEVPDVSPDFYQIVQAYAHAAADISDGLVADLGHIAGASGVTAQLCLADIKFSDAVSALLACNSVTLEDVLSGGDDYQILMALNPLKQQEFLSKANALGLKPQIIGRFVAGKPEVIIHDKQGAPVLWNKSGFQHF